MDASWTLRSRRSVRDLGVVYVVSAVSARACRIPRSAAGQFLSETRAAVAGNCAVLSQLPRVIVSPALVSLAADGVAELVQDGVLQQLIQGQTELREQLALLPAVGTNRASSRNVWRFSRIVNAGLSGSRPARCRIGLHSSDLTSTHVQSSSPVRSTVDSTCCSAATCVRHDWREYPALQTNCIRGAGWINSDPTAGVVPGIGQKIISPQDLAISSPGCPPDRMGSVGPRYAGGMGPPGLILGLSASVDGRSLVYSRHLPAWDLMMIENFR
jgi:hypothetical protein